MPHDDMSSLMPCRDHHAVVGAVADTHTGHDADFIAGVGIEVNSIVMMIIIITSTTTITTTTTTIVVRENRNLPTIHKHKKVLQFSLHFHGKYSIHSLIQLSFGNMEEPNALAREL